MRTTAIGLPLLQAMLALCLLLTGCDKHAKAKRSLAAAEQHFANEKYDEAEIEYMNTLREDAGNALAFRRMGTIFLERGDSLRAAQFLQAAKKMSPNDGDTQVAFAEAILSLGAAKEARKEVIGVLDREKSNGKALMLLTEISQTETERAEANTRIREGVASGSVRASVAAALLALRQNDLAVAETALQKAIASDSQLSSAQVVMAVLHEARRESAEADASFQEAVRLAPIRSNERIKYADFLNRTGKREQAVSLLQQTVEKAPDFLPGWRKLAQFAIEAKQFDDAQRSIDKVLARNSSDMDAHQLRAQLALAKGDNAAALSALEDLKRFMPPHPGLELQLARIYVLAGKENLAIEALNRVITMDPGQVEAPLFLAKLHLSRNESQKSAEILQKLLQTHPKDSRAQMMLAEAYRMQNRLSEAAGILQARMGGGQGGEQEHMSLGMVLRAQNKLSDARKEFEEAARLAPDNHLIVAQLIALDLLEQNYTAAQERVTVLRGKNPRSAGVLCMQAKIFEKQNQWSEAEEALKEAVKCQPEFLSSYGLLIRLYARNGRMKEAADELQKFLVQDPDNIAAWMQLGAIHQLAGRTGDARQCYEKTLSLNAGFAPALNNLAMMEVDRSGDLKKAADLAKRARAALPGDGAVADTLGWIMYLGGEVRDSLPLAQEAAVLLPEDATVQFHLGMITYAMHQPEKARVALRKAVATGQDFAGKDEANRKLSFLDQPSIDLQSLQERVTSDPKDVMAGVRLGDILAAEGRNEEALQAYARVIRANDELAEPYFRSALIYAGSLRDWAKVVEFAGKARELAPDDGRISALLGRAAFETGKHEWAYDLLRDSRSRVANDPLVTVDYAWAAYGLGKVEEARKLMEDAARSAVGSPAGDGAKRFLDVLSLAGKDSETVGNVVEPLLRENPRYVPALMAQATSLEAVSADKAVPILESVLIIYPNFTPAQKSLARIYSGREEKLVRAEELVRKARKTLPDDSDLSGVMARIKFMQRDYMEARRLLENVSGQRDLQVDEAYTLGMSLGELGEKEKARKWLERAIKGDLGESRTTQARAMLAKVQ